MTSTTRISSNAPKRLHADGLLGLPGGAGEETRKVSPFTAVWKSGYLWPGKNANPQVYLRGSPQAEGSARFLGVLMGLRGRYMGGVGRGKLCQLAGEARSLSGRKASWNLHPA